MSSDWWDDFFNNLATDLAPLVSLFGESPTKQFLSESVSLIDVFIFAMAPLGIITTVVSAIRVGGSPSLRAFIGRAQEGGGNIEAELCSSTSRDVCEMYNNGDIARVFGRPKILEIVHDPRADARDFYGLEGKVKSAGIYSFEEYIKSGKGNKEWDEVTGCQNILRLRKKTQEEPESRRSPKNVVNTEFAPHPNLSLNVGIKKRSAAWCFLAAVAGAFLQSGVLIFAGLSVFAYSERFQKDDKPVDGYAFPFTFAGTLFLCSSPHILVKNACYTLTRSSYWSLISDHEADEPLLPVGSRKPYFGKEGKKCEHDQPNELWRRVMSGQQKNNTCVNTARAYT